MQVDYCDICGIVIRHKFKITITDITGIEKSEEYQNLDKVNPLYRMKQAEGIAEKYVEEKEICKECRELYRLLGNMRAKEVAKLKKQLESILKAKTVKKGRKKSNGR